VLALASSDRRLQVRGWFVSAALSGEYEGDVERGRELLSAALGVAADIGDRALAVEGYLRLGFLLYNGGDLGGAEQAFAECIARSGELGSRRDETRALFNLGLIKFFRGDVEEAERLGARARAALEVTGETYFQIQNAAALALYALGRGEPALAEERLREALPLALEEGGWVLVEIYRLLVAALVGRGRIDEAGELVAFAARRVPEEHSYARAALLLARAYVAAARRHSEALTLFEQALELLDGLSLPLESSQARLAYADALEALGEPAAAQRQLEEAHAVCTQVGASGLCAQIAARFEVEAAGPFVPAPPPSTV
jgi:tetratricopeptide (TPR) repeat protein